MPGGEEEKEESWKLELIFVNYKAVLDTFSFRCVNFRFSSVRENTDAPQISNLFIMVTRQL